MADVVVSTSNTVASRILIAQLAVGHQITHIFAAVEGGRLGYGGTVGIWSPQRRDLACQSCYFSEHHLDTVPNTSLVTTVVTVVAGVAAHLIVRCLTARSPGRFLEVGNLMTLDLASWTLELSRVRRRTDCKACPPSKRP
jgi:hypothetical protein